MIDNLSDALLFSLIISSSVFLGYQLGSYKKESEIANGNYKKEIKSIEYNKGIPDTTYTLIKIE